MEYCIYVFHVQINKVICIFNCSVYFLFLKKSILVINIYLMAFLSAGRDLPSMQQAGQSPQTCNQSHWEASHSLDLNILMKRQKDVRKSASTEDLNASDQDQIRSSADQKWCPEVIWGKAFQASMCVGQTGCSSQCEWTSRLHSLWAVEGQLFETVEEDIDQRRSSWSTTTQLPTRIHKPPNFSTAPTLCRRHCFWFKTNRTTLRPVLAQLGPDPSWFLWRMPFWLRAFRAIISFPTSPERIYLLQLLL